MVLKDGIISHISKLAKIGESEFFFEWNVCKEAFPCL
jgi:hypothetical protein